MTKIPCTVAILTKNSAQTLPRALNGLSEFAQIIVCDGGSTDQTCALAESAGATIIKQDPLFLGEDGRLRNFAGARNQTLTAATEPWFFFLDSDEYVDEALVNEVRTICEKNTTGAYWMPRKYVYQGRVVECAAAYPNKSMRLFARTSVTEFIKVIHERISLREKVIPVYMHAHLSVPVATDIFAQRRKGNRYILLQIEQAGKFGFGYLLYVTYRTGLSSAAYGVRMIRSHCFCRGEHMPIRHEFEDLSYNVRLVIRFWGSYLCRWIYPS